MPQAKHLQVKEIKHLGDDILIVAAPKPETKGHH
jgi:hypothetical protein